MPRIHRYAARIVWTGNTGAGTADRRAYERAHEIHVAGRPVLLGSSDPSFGGDPSRHNPEELFLAALSACHMLWYLGLCAEAGVTVTAYEDEAEGVMEEAADGGGRFARVVLHPRVTVADGADLAAAERLHGLAHARCFIANSVNFPVEHVARIAAAREA